MKIIIIMIIKIIIKTWEHCDTVVVALGCKPPFALFGTSDNYHLDHDNHDDHDDD